ncbi:hypothetical protein N7462_003336 [Penicillium macrosclerotiorum]|uniref:uncharacterized protein n=1 Tax=Penicillium macrosclerotiorum TaxID=303699 RepID=UPI002548E90E|nr:uncharacterized protein N7462_003336 [Penicillium macrosclerotiorum]KAJ5688944.1 hypothetical protein N7462_003336 [Penicillium macrosclerotiorum]
MTHIQTDLQAAEVGFLEMIKTSGDFKYGVNSGVMVKIPYLYHSIPEFGIQLVEDRVNSQLLKMFLLSPPSEPHVQEKITSIGEAIGQWLEIFHAWGRGHIDEDLMEKLRRNEDLHCKDANPLYESVVNQCDDEILRQAVFMTLNKNDRRVQGVIHGDFSPRNILIQYNNLPTGTELTVIDWETITYENQLHDFANMMGIIYIQHCLSGGPSFKTLLQGFVRGYRKLSADLIADALILTGVWILFFRQIIFGVEISDRPRSQEHENLKKLAVDVISKGMKEGFGSIEDAFLGPLSSV